MKIWVDPEKCQGHARCFGLAPELFELDDDLGHSSAINELVLPEKEPLAERAVANCPERAIVVER